MPCPGLYSQRGVAGPGLEGHSLAPGAPRQPDGAAVQALTPYPPSSVARGGSRFPHVNGVLGPGDSTVLESPCLAHSAIGHAAAFRDVPATC